MASAFSMLRGAQSSRGSTSAAQSQPQATVTSMSRWSVLNKQLPPADKIKALHVYDFDNTLFKTPLPNPTLWQGTSIGLLSSQDALVGGGWWHDNRILAATGEGLDKEEPRAWEGWWNDKIVDLVRLSLQQPDALCVLLTGRSEHGFGELVRRIVASKDLDFHMVSLKPKAGPNHEMFSSTMHFKQLFLSELMETYRNASEIKMYEDRPKHTKGFREYFAEFNRRQSLSPTRGTIAADVVQVADLASSLDPVVEVAQVQHMINTHNSIVTKQGSKRQLRIKKTVYFTSYMVGQEDSQKLIRLANIPSHVHDTELKYHGNNILICPRPCPSSILDKVGGMGSKMSWEVTGTACYENSIWAACLRPVPQNAKYHTDNPVPLVVLALRKGAKPIDAGKIETWQSLPQERMFTFDTVVGEKVILRIEPEDPREDEYESLFANKSSKRKHIGDEGWNARNSYGNSGGRNESRGYHTSNRGGGPSRGRGGRGRGDRGGPRGGGRGRGRGGYNSYRPVDDADHRGGHHHGPRDGGYDDAYPPLGAPRVPSGGQYGRPPPPQERGSGPSRPMGGQGSGGQDLQKWY